MTEVLQIAVDAQKIIDAMPGSRDEIRRKTGLSWKRFLKAWETTADRRWQVGTKRKWKWERKP